MTRILIVEDDAHLAEGLEYNLSREGYEVVVARDGDEGARQAIDAQPALIVLDLMLPGRSGFEVLRELDERGSTVPVIVLSARGQEADKLRGFDLGAVDYMTKPFSVGELIARALKGREDEQELTRVREGVSELCERFPLYAARRARATPAD